MIEVFVHDAKVVITVLDLFFGEGGEGIEGDAFQVKTVLDLFDDA